MPYMKSTELYSHFKSGKPYPVDIFAGEEDYLKQEACRSIEKLLEINPLSREILFYSEASLNEAILNMQSLPFFGDKRLFILKNVQKIKSADSKQLVEVLEDLISSSYLIIYWDEKLKPGDKKSDLFSAVEGIGAIVEFRGLYERELPQWVIGKIRNHSKSITSEAADFLIQESGSNLMNLSSEIEKLVLFTKGKNEITLSDIEYSSGHTRQANINQLTEAIESKKISKALAVVEELLSEGEVPIKILNSIYWCVRRQLIAKSLLEEKKLKADQAAKELRIHPYFARDFFARLSNYSIFELKEKVGEILKADIELKSSSRPQQMVFEELLAV